jgi:small subunit ribosomal protein S1
MALGDSSRPQPGDEEEIVVDEAETSGADAPGPVLGEPDTSVQPLAPLTQVDPMTAEPEPVEPVGAEPEPVEPVAAEPEPADGELPVPVAKPAVPPVKIVEGVVTSVSPEEVELTLDDGRAAVISRRNFGPDNEDPTTVISVGDRAFGAKLTREDPKKRVVLSRAWALKLKAWDVILEAAARNETVKARVVSVGGKGVVVDAAGVRGFVPSSHLELTSVSDLSSYVNQVLDLKVLEAEPLRERLVLSRRSLLLKESRRKTQDLLTSLKPGDRASGKVTSIVDYGVFVDIGGVNGLVHLSELSWHRVRRAGDVVALGDEVEVVVLDVKAKKRRISLSIRQAKPDPLTELTVGTVRPGRVTRLVDFGAFVALDDVEGLVHLSELAEYRVSTPDEVVAPGDEVGVKVLSVDLRRRRVELSIRQAAEFGG